MNIDSIIFDLDGTLWNSTGGVLIAWVNTLRNYKDVKRQITKEDLESVMGLQVNEIGEKLFPGLRSDMQAKLLKECCMAECEYLCNYGGILYENLEETLIRLSEKYKLFIVSNCEVGYIESFYEYHKLKKYFCDFENPGRTGLSKGENIKLIMKRNNLKNPVYVGDTTGDLKAAKAAGIPFIYASYGFGKVNEYDYVIDKFEDLLRISSEVFR